MSNEPASNPPKNLVSHQRVETPDGVGHVVGVAPFTEPVKVRFGTHQVEEYAYDELTTFEPAPDAPHGRVGRRREPSPQPSHAARCAAVGLSGYTLILGYTHAVYATVTPDDDIVVFKGWKQFSTDSEAHVTALEAIADRSVSGAPQYQDAHDAIVVRQETTAAPEVFPDELWRDDR